MLDEEFITEEEELIDITLLLILLTEDEELDMVAVLELPVLTVLTDEFETNDELLPASAVFGELPDAPPPLHALSNIVVDIINKSNTALGLLIIDSAYLMS